MLTASEYLSGTWTNFIGNGASGNLIALQLPRLTSDESILGNFSLRSYLYSRNLALKLEVSPKTEGVVVFPSRNREIKKFTKLIDLKWDKQLFSKYIGHFHKNYEISHIFPNAGIVDNIKFLKKLTKNVKLINNFEVLKIKNVDDEKLIFDKKGRSLKAKSIIWANGYNIKDILMNNLIIPVSGHVTYLRSNKNTNNLNLNFSFGNFLSQSYLGLHQIGSSFYRNNIDIKKVDGTENFDKLPNFLKNDFQFSTNDIIDSRFGIRATTKNNLPFFGHLEDLREFYLGGMGSWGFIYGPFMAEILVRKMLDEPMLVEDFILNSLDIEKRI